MGTGISRIRDVEGMMYYIGEAFTDATASEDATTGTTTVGVR